MNKTFKLIAVITLLLIMAFTEQARAQKATWIWYPGDYDIWLGNQMQNRRTERGTFFPPFWKMAYRRLICALRNWFKRKT